jgi:hypothetical protein
MVTIANSEQNIDYATPAEIMTEAFARRDSQVILLWKIGLSASFRRHGSRSFRKYCFEGRR